MAEAMPLPHSVSNSTASHSTSLSSNPEYLSTAFTDSAAHSCSEDRISQPTNLSRDLAANVNIPLRPDKSIYSFTWSSCDSDFHLSDGSQQIPSAPELFGEMSGNSRGAQSVHGEREKTVSRSSARRVAPTLPSPTFWSTLAHPELFAKYIQANELLPRDRNLKPPPGSPVSFKDHPSEALSKRYGNIKAIVKANTDESKIVRNCTTEWISDHFKDDKLPKPFNITTFEDSALWKKAGHGVSGNIRPNFSKLPNLDNKEKTVEWLDHLATNLRRCHGIADTGLKNHRHFTSEGANKCLSGGLHGRKPDIILMDENYRNLVPPHIRIKWSLVQAIIEVTSQDARPFSEHMRGILTKAANILHAQIHRQFVIAIVIYGKGNKMSFFCCIIDRVNASCTQPLLLTGYGGRLLARIIFGLTLGDDILLGFDPAFTIDRLTGDPIHVIVDNQKFIFITEIFNSPYLFGRGTRVFIVQSDNDGRYYILKDSWILASHNVSEADNIKMINKAAQSADVDPRLRKLLPQLIACDENAGSTALNRSLLLGACDNERRRRRLITGPIGDPITSYCSRVECLQAFIDITDRKYSKWPFPLYITHLLYRTEFHECKMSSCPRRHINEQHHDSQNASEYRRSVSWF